MSLAYFLPVIGIPLGIDPFHYILEREGVPSLISVPVRATGLLLFVHSACQSGLFLYIFNLIVFQAYIGCLTLMRNFANDQRLLLTELNKLALVHNRSLSPFTNRATGSVMFLGHTTCLMLLWLGVRGWGLLPGFLTLLLPTFGVFVAALVVLTLTVQSWITNKSRELIRIAGRGSKSRAFERKAVKALRPLVFRSGSWFVVGRVSPGAFLMTLSENLTSLILTF